MAFGIHGKPHFATQKTVFHDMEDDVCKFVKIA